MSKAGIEARVRAQVEAEVEAEDNRASALKRAEAMRAAANAAYDAAFADYSPAVEAAEKKAASFVWRVETGGNEYGAGTVPVFFASTAKAEADRLAKNCGFYGSGTTAQREWVWSSVEDRAEYSRAVDERRRAALAASDAATYKF